MTRATKPSFPTCNTGSNLHWGWFGLEMRLYWTTIVTASTFLHINIGLDPFYRELRE